MNFYMTNTELQKAIDPLLSHFNGKNEWCVGGSPDGAISQALAELVTEQARRCLLIDSELHESKN